MTSALLQLPLSMSKREKQQRVVAIIDQLVSISAAPHDGNLGQLLGVST